MQRQALASLFRTIVLAGIAALSIVLTAPRLPAQNSAPQTAVQAAKMPQYASRLARPVDKPAARPNPARPGSRNGPQQYPTIYENGPINGTTDAWLFNSGFVVSDSITIANDGDAPLGMSFGVWLLPGDTLESAELSLTSSPNGGTSYFDQNVNFTQSGCINNPLGYNVCTVSVSFTGPTLNAGTYWVNLQDGFVNTGDPVYWDENSGAGCESEGCPSQAYQNNLGTIPSESFSMQGYSNLPPPSCFQPEGNLRVLYNLTQQQAGTSLGPEGVTIDNAGNLYGATYNGGNNGDGFVYKLASFGSWVLDPLFSFLGGDTGSQPPGVMVGPNGSLYGGAQGGIQNCGTDGSQYCGLVFNLTPKPNICGTALCGWNENVLYRFNSESDGGQLVNVTAFDQAGNLYGTTYYGGTHDMGTVFELTPTGGGNWTKTVLYNFTGNFDGSLPTQVLLGNDGNLYGVGDGRNFEGDGVVFQLTPSGGHWTESVLHRFHIEHEGWLPSHLSQDSAGNLYGMTATQNIDEVPYGVVFTLQKQTLGWTFDEDFIQHNCAPGDLTYDYLNNLTVDAAGNVYGTGVGALFQFGKRDPGQDQCSYSYIFKASYGSDGWHYEDGYFRYSAEFDSFGSLAIDPSGNLYGTTTGCGTNGYGTVWQLSP